MHFCTSLWIHYEMIGEGGNLDELIVFMWAPHKRLRITAIEVGRQRGREAV